MIQSTTNTSVTSMEREIQSTNSQFTDMGGAEFMQLLLAQLRNQNPLDPMGDSEMLTQFAQLNSLDELKAINRNVEALHGSSSIVDAANLIGRSVEVRNEEGLPESGIVTGVSLNDGQTVIQVGGEIYPISSLMSVFLGGIV